MGRILRRIFIWGAAAIGVLILAAVAVVGPQYYRIMVGSQRYETTPPELPAQLNETAVLIFSKTNNYRHEEAINAADAALAEIAARRGWSLVTTENGAVFNPEQLARFKAVIWNNVSGDVLTPEQKEAFQSWLEAGGGYVGFHGSGGDWKYKWRWYEESVIGAQFIGHPMDPEFQQATVHIEDNAHPATRDLGKTWIHTDEWYSFSSNPREKGYRILASIDESTYSPVMHYFGVFAKDLHMGDHPVIWEHCVGNGRVFYSAIGHPAAAYSEPEYRKILEGAVAWAAGLEGPRCVNGAETTD